MAEHSYWSASSFAADMACPGKKVMEHGKPDNANEHAASGTATHQVITWALKSDKDAWAYLGRVLQLDAQGRVLDQPVESPAFEFEVDEDRCARAQQCIDYVRDVAGTDGMVLVDQKVNYAHALKVEQDTAWGTLDVAVLKGAEIIVIDYKDGKKPVAAGDDETGEPNAQMGLYGLGAEKAFGSMHDQELTHARLVIIQPRVSSAPAEFDIPLASLRRWAEEKAVPAVAKCQQAEAFDDGPVDEFVGLFLNPSDACTFCKAKGTCPALRDDMTDAGVGRATTSPDEFAAIESLPVGEFSELAWLERIVQRADLWESMFAAARGELERRLLNGETSALFKVVQGKKGNREWASAEEVTAYLKDTVRLNTEAMYSLKLKGPAPIEKLAPKLDKEGKPKPLKPGEPEPIIGPRQWAKLQKMIIQREGKPHVAPIDDPRPALTVTPVANEFSDVTVDPNDFA